MEYRTLELGEILEVGDMVIDNYSLLPVVKGGEKCIDINLLRPINARVNEKYLELLEKYVQLSHKYLNATETHQETMDKLLGGE